MSEVKWIKIVTDIFDDEKILLIENLPEADSIIVIWFKLLCLAGKQNNSGVFIMGNGIPYTDKMLSTIFRRKETTIKLALKTFENFGMIEIINGAITIPNWEKHQKLDQLELSREQTRKRVAKYREKQKLLITKEENNILNNDSLSKCNVTVTQSNADRIDKNREDKNKIDKNNNNNKSDSCINDSVKTNDSCVDGLQVVVDFYENNIGLITPYGRDILLDYLEEMPKDLIIFAMQKAVEADVRTIKYIKGILNNWSKKGIKTVLEAQKEDEEFKNRKMPKEETEEERQSRILKEMEERLKDDTN